MAINIYSSLEAGNISCKNQFYMHLFQSSRLEQITQLTMQESKSLEVSYLELVGNIGMDRNGLMMMCCWRFKVSEKVQALFYFILDVQRMSLIILMLSKYPVREVLPGFKVVEWVLIIE